jgi:hypothetical protein
VRTIARDRVLPGQLVGLRSLPAGDYRVRISTTEPRAGVVRVVLGRGGVLVEHDLASLPVGRDGRASFDVELPMDVDAFAIEANGSTAVSASVAVTELWPDAARVSGERAITGRGYGPVTAFFPTDAQYAERGGIWVKAGGQVPMVLDVAPGTSRLTLFVRNGPLANHVDVSFAGSAESADLAPNQETSFDLRWPTGTRATTLRIRAAEAFRPIDVDPATGDLRRLGVWIELRP